MTDTSIKINGVEIVELKSVANLLQKVTELPDPRSELEKKVESTLISWFDLEPEDWRLKQATIEIMQNFDREMGDL